MVRFDLALWLVLWSGATLCCMPRACAQETDLAPANGVIVGCEAIDQRDPRIVSVLCAPSLDGLYPRGQVYYIATGELMASRTERERFNITLNALLGHHLGVPSLPKNEIESQAILAELVNGLTRESRYEFLSSAFQIRDSDVWTDGYRWAVYEILAGEFLQPVGLELLARHIREAADESRPIDVRRSDVTLLILREPQRWIEPFRRLASATDGLCEPSSVRELGLLAAIGLVRGGETEAGIKIVARIREDASEKDIQHATKQADKIRSQLHNLPDDEKTLHSLLHSWFELEYD